MIKKLTVSTLAFLGAFAAISPAQAALVQNTSLLDLVNGGTIAGSTGTLTRTATGIETSVSTSNLSPGAAYTMWWVIFNNPEFCVDGCGGDDFSNSAVNASVFFADGKIIDPDGLGTFSSQIGIGELPNPNQVELGNGLFNPLTAEVWNVVRDHGPASSDPALLEAQLTTFNGGCSLTPGDGGFPCRDEQLAVFATPVPEPATTTGLIVLGTLGVLSRFQRPKN
jgi:hypothetical protein